jgi:hypothetical protein
VGVRVINRDQPGPQGDRVPLGPTETGETNRFYRTGSRSRFPFDDGEVQPRPRRETAAAKADRLLTTRRVHFVRVDGPDVDAIVEGDHETYVLGRRRGRLVCSCPSPGPCSHGRAVDAVVDPAPEAER